MEQIQNLWTQATEQFPILLGFGTTILSALAILILGWIVARWFRKRLRNIKLGRHEIDPTLRPILASAVFYVIMAMTLYAFLIKLGVPPTSLIAVFGAAGLAIGLALKDTLSNIAAGVLMLILRPLSVGDFISTGNNSGTVMEIGLFATTLKTADGLFIYIPNSAVWPNHIQNFGRHSIRKAIVDIGVAYDTDLKHTQSLLLSCLEKTPDLLTYNETGHSPAPSAPEVYIMNFGDSAITLSCRCWLPADNWLQRMSDLRTTIKSTLDEAGIDIPFPQRVVTMKEKS
jgi:small conductance mechanosensitive channel